LFIHLNSFVWKFHFSLLGILEKVGKSKTKI